MSIFQSIILGIVQGLTEFIPVSSSAHLVLIPDVLKWAPAGVYLDVMLHVGTLLAAGAYFWKDLVEIITKKRKMIWLLAIGTVPAVVFGLAFKTQLESFFETPTYSAYFLIVTGAMLAAADLFAKQKKKTDSVTPLNALWIGVAQAIAILPGISRSGATISAGMFAGLDRAAATRFAFLLSMPIVAGAALLKTKDALEAGGSATVVISAIPGALAAAIVGYLAIHFLLKYLSKHSLIVFSVYCWLVAGLYLLTR